MVANIEISGVKIKNPESVIFQCTFHYCKDFYHEGEIVMMRPFACGPLLEVEILERSGNIMRFRIINGELNLTPNDYL